MALMRRGRNYLNRQRRWCDRWWRCRRPMLGCCGGGRSWPGPLIRCQALSPRLCQRQRRAPHEWRRKLCRSQRQSRREALTEITRRCAVLRRVRVGFSPRLTTLVALGLSLINEFLRFCAKCAKVPVGQLSFV
ncbi:hypothetical protein HYQ46_008255 [Verticillium longisporum]|nr:hypothetical protein HYQ46_008255 [Verticillium longisporum]